MTFSNFPRENVDIKLNINDIPYISNCNYIIIYNFLSFSFIDKHNCTNFGFVVFNKYFSFFCLYLPNSLPYVHWCLYIRYQS